jgi:hypothetical protein
VPAYLGQLAANATTIINMRGCGRAVYDLATPADCRAGAFHRYYGE